MKKWLMKNGLTLYRIIYGRSNVFLLSNGKSNILIDTSVGRNLKLLTEKIDSICSNNSNLDYIILTHTHYDHTGNAAKLAQKYNAKIIVHITEAENLKNGTCKLPQGSIPITKFLVNRFGNKVDPSFEACSYDITVDSFYDLTELGFDAYIMHTPGHTEGSISVIISNEIAIVGDAMFGIFRGSIFPPYADNVKQLVTSWGQLLETCCSLYIPAHGSPNTNTLVEKQYNKHKSKG